jgi:ABC-type cobalamin/Fe3+-siderophores transport system ATPase subunit
VVANNVSTFVQSTSFKFDVQKPIPRFVGRKKELTELTAALSCDTKRRWVVAGPGGMGKSQLMKKFLDDNKNENNCVWLHGETIGCGTWKKVTRLSDLPYIHCSENFGTEIMTV